jgi:hypothetical protein
MPTIIAKLHPPTSQAMPVMNSQAPITAHQITRPSINPANLVFSTTLLNVRDRGKHTLPRSNY